MQRSMAGLALGILLSPLFTTAAHAATTIDTAAFTLAVTDGPLPEDWNIGLAGQSGNTYDISLASLAAHLTTVEVPDVTGVGAWDGRSDWNQLLLTVRAGYRVTGLAIAGTATGVVAPGQLPDFPPGRAGNAASFYLSVWTPSVTTYGQQFTDFQGDRALATGNAHLALEGDTVLGLSGFLSAEAWGVEGDGAFAGSLASAGWRDLMLQVTVSPVPEPTSWRLLLGGLAGVALLGRYRRRVTNL